MERTRTRWVHLVGIAGVATMLLVPHLAAGTDWTRFRGPNGRGVADAANPPTDLDRAEGDRVEGAGRMTAPVIGVSLYLLCAALIHRHLRR